MLNPQLPKPDIAVPKPSIIWGPNFPKGVFLNKLIDSEESLPIIRVIFPIIINSPSIISNEFCLLKYSIWVDKTTFSGGTSNNSPTNSREFDCVSTANPILILSTNSFEYFFGVVGGEVVFPGTVFWGVGLFIKLIS